MSSIVVNRICKSFGENEVLKDLSVSFSQEKITCLMGPSGCGKTTLLNIMAGLTAADKGEIIGLPDKISYVFQEDRLCESFRAATNVRIAASKNVTPEIIKEILEKLGINDPYAPVSDFSGGMKRRVAIARALCAPFDLLLMDEPFKGLDEDTRSIAAEVIKEYLDGRTAVFVSHDRTDAELLDAEIIDFSSVNGKAL